MTDNKRNVKNNSVEILWSVIKQVLQKSKSSHSYLIREWKLEYGSN